MTSRAWGYLCAALMSGAPGVPAWSQTAAPAGALACSGCHGAASEGAMPSLSGQSAEQIAGAMRAFKTGERPATLMNRIARGFSDDELDAIARWLAAR
jgi:cytochrome subunit of sulfide dehydrogenase